METTTQTPSLTPRFFFISLGVIISLITSASAFLVLLFEILNKKFPDALNSTYQYGYYSYDFETIKGTIATLIIFFPVFLLLSYYWRKISKKELGAKDNVIFKWMIYLVLFLASLLIVIDLVTLVRYFVSGEITSRFIFKVLGAAVVACLIGYNYLYELKNHNNLNIKSRISLLCTIKSIVLFFAIIVWSFIVMGSPSQQRAWRLDETRKNDLQSIQGQVINYWQQKGTLPATLIELSNPISSFIVPVDPEFDKGRVYEYIPKDNLTFDLCATFTSNTPNGLRESNYSNITGPMSAGGDVKTTVAFPNYPSGLGINDSWNHGVGRTCFTRTIDKDIYPPFKK
jgi:hypothetical protein